MLMDNLLRDTRNAVRRLLRDWRFTAAAILILGLGIGANTASFSVINAALLRGTWPPTRSPRRHLSERPRAPSASTRIRIPRISTWRSTRDVFESTTAASMPYRVSYQHDGALLSASSRTRPRRIRRSSDCSRRSAAGSRRPKTRLDAAVVAVLGHQTWIRRFRADPRSIGRTIHIDGVPVTMSASAPPSRGTFNIGLVTDFWLPISAIPALRSFLADARSAIRRSGVLREGAAAGGVAVAQAQAAMNILGADSPPNIPRRTRARASRSIATRDVRIHPQLDALLRGVASSLLGVVGLVLAVACSNLATLLLVRGAARAKEVSVRLALGATGVNWCVTCSPRACCSPSAAAWSAA